MKLMLQLFYQFWKYNLKIFIYTCLVGSKVNQMVYKLYGLSEEEMQVMGGY